MDAKQQITATRFDAIVRGPEKLWGLSNIAGAIGLSVDATRRLAADQNAPIYRPNGCKRYFALRSELNSWLRSRSDAA